MFCNYFGICGSCTIFGVDYASQLRQKVDEQIASFRDLFDGHFEVFASETQAFRARAEFKIYHDDFGICYAMNTKDKKFVTIQNCQIVNGQISQMMPKLIKSLQEDELLSRKLFGVEFLTSCDEVLVTLIYHKKLDDDWIALAKKIQSDLNIKIIGRSRGQKVVLSDDFVTQKIEIDKRQFAIIQKESGFSQPNSGVNSKMLSWVLKNISSSGDLCELYCGGGNFTIALSAKFRKVLATEISKTSIASAKQSCILSGVENIEFLRMSSEDFTSALNKEREFFRLKDISLDDYDFSTIFIDPPRAGVDEKTLELVARFENIIYISCNPVTLKRDLEILNKTHKISRFAFFDQFAWTHHIESGVILTKNL